jgi:hypothetical protein
MPGSLGRRLGGPGIRRGIRGAASFVRAIPLLSQTFTRSGEGSHLTAAPGTGASAFLAFAATDVIRAEDRGDGAGPLVLLERASTNLLKQSRDPTNAAAWLEGAVGSTTTANAGNGPDGTAVADRIQAAGVAFSRGQAPTGAANPHVLSAWGRATSGTSIWCANYAGGPAWNVPAQSTTYTRKTVLRAGAVSTYYPADATLASATPQDVLVDLHQVEDGRYPTSAIRTSASNVTRGADTLALLATPAWLLNGAARFAQVSPIFANTELASGDIRWLFTIGSSSDGVRIRHNGTNVVVEAVQGGVVRASSGALTFSAHALLGVVMWNPVTAIVSVGGVAGSAGTPWTWSTGTVRIGGIQGSSGSEADCRLALTLEPV